MKVCVISFSGNVGKSTISLHLLKPRLLDSIVITVESVITGERNDQYFSDIMDKIIEHDNVIVDVSASDTSDFLKKMKEYIGSHECFDMFVVPVVFQYKQIKDAALTIDCLSKLLISKDRIKVICNLVNSQVEDVDSWVDYISESINHATVSEGMCIEVNEILDLLYSTPNISISDITNDETDYRSLIMKSDEHEKQLRSGCSYRMAQRRLAVSCERMLDDTYTHLMV